MERADCRQRLSEVLEAELAATGRLLATLAAEQKALARQEREGVEAATAAKDTHLRELEHLERQRAALARTAGYNSDRTAMEACIRWCDGAGGHLLAQWERLLEQVRQCQAQNQLNGGILELSRRHVQSALDILRGQVPGARLYGPAGETAGGASGRALGKA